MLASSATFGCSVCVCVRGGCRKGLYFTRILNMCGKSWRWVSRVPPRPGGKIMVWAFFVRFYALCFSGDRCVSSPRREILGHIYHICICIHIYVKCGIYVNGELIPRRENRIMPLSTARKTHNRPHTHDAAHTAAHGDRVETHAACVLLVPLWRCGLLHGLRIELVQQLL